MVFPIVAQVVHRHVVIGDVRIFYRESVPVSNPSEAPAILLLHGFPSASHQFRRLMDVLGSRYRLIAPDYPGLGYSDVPLSTSDGGTFRYSFDALADAIEGFVQHLGLTRMVLYMFDWGAPVGFRLALRHPEWVAGLVVQNGNAYREGLSEEARRFIGLQRHDPGAEKSVRSLLTLEATRSQYETGATDPRVIAPDGWTLDQHFLDQPGRTGPQLDLAFDYKSNLECYPEWQAWLRAHQPPMLVLWGRNDPFFVVAGGQAYLRDVPDAELHIFETGHFALEEMLPEIAPLVADFLDRNWTAARPGTTNG